jgi:hypothetical protein
VSALILMVVTPLRVVMDVKAMVFLAIQMSC